MSIFNHHVYEYKKGLRNLVLYTGKTEEIDEIRKKLERENIDYYIQKVNSDKINVFFGSEVCVKIIKQMKDRLFAELKEEDDFIIGIMLGYDRLKQCERYIRKTN